MKETASFVAMGGDITEPAEFARLLRAIDRYQGSPVLRSALQLEALTFVRSQELRLAEWRDIDLGAREWRFEVLMSRRGERVVPLANRR